MSITISTIHYEVFSIVLYLTVMKAAEEHK